MTEQEKKPKSSNGKTQWVIWLVAVALSLAGAAIGIQLQQNDSATEQNSRDIVKLEDQTEDDLRRVGAEFEQEIARLDESNRNRRNDLAALEERIAILETVVTEKASVRELSDIKERVATLEAKEFTE